MVKHQLIIWKTIQVVCWIIFIGFCIQAGILLFNFSYSLWNPEVSQNLYMGLNLNGLINENFTLYVFVGIILIALSIFKASLFYSTIQIFKMINVYKPFSIEISRRISNITLTAFILGLSFEISHAIIKYLEKSGYSVQETYVLLNDGESFLLMSAVLFVISFVFKKGVELQTENVLTI